MHIFSEFKECFNLFDGDSDGMVTEKELGLIMRSLGENITHFEIQELMNKAGKFTSPYWRQLNHLEKQLYHCQCMRWSWIINLMIIIVLFNYPALGCECFEGMGSLI